jgi:predicted transposase YbfD/YdcC
MGCQKEIVKSIVDKSGEYVIALKKNQGNLYKNVEKIFKEAISKGFEGFKCSDFHTKQDEHGREEIRHYLMLSDIQERIDPGKKWINLQSVGMVEHIRKVNGKTKVDTRYYISSLTDNAKLLGESVRSHWGIENSLHWVLDVGLREDDCRIRKDNAPQNFAVLRHIAVNAVRKEKSQKLGIKNKQVCAGWDNKYLEKILECI